MRIVVDRDRCIGSGMCVLTLPGVFDQSDEDGQVLVQKTSPEPYQLDSVRRAVRLCPMSALSLDERRGPVS